MEGRADTGYKQVQRFLHRADLRLFLRRLFQEGNRVCPGRSYRGGNDPKPKRPNMWETRSLWLLLLMYQGWAIPLRVCGPTEVALKRDASLTRSPGY